MFTSIYTGPINSQWITAYKSFHNMLYLTPRIHLDSKNLAYFEMVNETTQHFDLSTTEHVIVRWFLGNYLCNQQSQAWSRSVVHRLKRRIISFFVPN